MVLMSSPYHYFPFQSFKEYGMFEMYYGSEQQARENSALSHLLNWFDSKPKDILPKILLIEAQYEPEWIFNLGIDFHRALEWHLNEPIKLLVVDRHNHMSLFCALSSGEGEEWGVETAEWMWNVLKVSG